MVKSVSGFLVLVLFWWLGEQLAPRLPMPLPAPLVGLLLLFFALLLIGRVPEGLLKTSQFLLKHLSIFFIPAILSVVLLQDLLLAHFWAIAVALVASTLFSLWLTALICQRLKQDDL